jgi:hypothetical protein
MLLYKCKEDDPYKNKEPRRKTKMKIEGLEEARKEFNGWSEYNVLLKQNGRKFDESYVELFARGLYMYSKSIYRIDLKLSYRQFKDFIRRLAENFKLTAALSASVPLLDMAFYTHDVKLEVEEEKVEWRSSYVLLNIYSEYLPNESGHVDFVWKTSSGHLIEISGNWDFDEETLDLYDEIVLELRLGDDPGENFYRTVLEIYEEIKCTEKEEAE